MSSTSFRSKTCYCVGTFAFPNVKSVRFSAEWKCWRFIVSFLIKFYSLKTLFKRCVRNSKWHFVRIIFDQNEVFIGWFWKKEATWSYYLYFRELQLLNVPFYLISVSSGQKLFERHCIHTKTFDFIPTLKSCFKIKQFEEKTDSVHCWFK